VTYRIGYVLISIRNTYSFSYFKLNHFITKISINDLDIIVDYKIRFFQMEYLKNYKLDY